MTFLTPVSENGALLTNCPACEVTVSLKHHFTYISTRTELLSADWLLPYITHAHHSLFFKYDVSFYRNHSPIVTFVFIDISDNHTHEMQRQTAANPH